MSKNETSPITRGQRVFCGLYGGKRGIVAAIIGEQQPSNIRSLHGGAVVAGGNAYLEIAFENGTLSRVPEAIVRGCQWQIFPEVATDEQIHEALAAVLQKQIDDEFKAQQAARDEANLRDRLASEYAWLQRVKDGEYAGPVLAAQNIRTELKRTFPGVKFSVRSSRYSGGNSVHVEWTNGPKEAAVNDILDKYEAGRFDGMDDSYNYKSGTARVWCELFGSAKYTSTTREFTESAILHAMATLATRYGHTGEAFTMEDWKQGRLWYVELPKGAGYGDFQRGVREYLHGRDGADLVPAPAPEPQAEPAALPQSCIWSPNEAKGGIEIRFPEPPLAEVRELLKAEGFRWSQRGGCWWAKATPATEATARQIAANMLFMTA